MLLRKVIMAFASVWLGCVPAWCVDHHVGADVRSGYVFSSNSELLKRLDSDVPHTHVSGSLHVSYGIGGLGDSLTCGVVQGLGLGVTTFGAPRRVGTPVSVYAFQRVPVCSLGEGVRLDYEWNFGAATGWHRTTAGFRQVSNLVVGSRTNAYLNLGFMLDWRIAPAWRLTCGVDLTHYSNGNTSWPNPGVNSVGGRVGVAYVPGGDVRGGATPFGRVPGFRHGLVWDVMAFGAWRKSYFPYERGGFDSVGEAYLLLGHFAVAGMSVSPLWKFHPRFRAGVSADFQWSACAGFEQDGYDYIVPPAWRQMSLGLSARGEVVMPVFSLNVGIGYGLAGPWETRMLYQTVTLKTYVWRGAYLNVGYRLYKFRSPSNLMLGVGYTIGH